MTECTLDTEEQTGPCFVFYCSGQIGALQSTNPTRQFSSHLFNDRGEVKNKLTKLLEVVFQK